MELFEKITRLFFAVLFGGVLILLAVETAVRRRLAERRRSKVEPLASVYQRHPKTRPTITGPVDWEDLPRDKPLTAGLRTVRHRIPVTDGRTWW